MFRPNLFLIFAIITTLLSSTSVALDVNRKALVVGNANYEIGALANPHNDAHAMIDSLTELGFEVDYILDANRAELEHKVYEFYSSITANDATLFYYAGHAVQYKNQNFIIPVNSKIRSEEDMVRKAYNLNRLLANLEKTKNFLNFIVLDACRNNPFSSESIKESGRSLDGLTRGLKTLNDGLVAVKAPPGTYIAFATEPGRVAADGDGENGTYTKHLLSHLKTPRLDIEAMFKRVRLGVIEESHGNQVPWEHSSLTKEFFFVSPDIEAEERKHWLSVSNTDDVTEIDEYLNKYPNGLYVELALIKKAELQNSAKRKKMNKLYSTF